MFRPISFFSMRRSFVGENIARLCLCLAIVMGVYVSIWVISNIAMDHPLEYRESAMVISTDIILRGENLFSIDKQPVFSNQYGLVYNWIVYPFAKIFGNTLLVHRSISVLFIIFTCVVFLMVLRRSDVPWVYSLLGPLLLASSFGMGLSIVARPDSVGMFFFLSSLVIPWWFRFCWSSLFVALLFAVLAFLTKAYFLLALPILALYLFCFESKQKGFLFGCAAAIALTLTVLVVHSVYECYFTNIFFVTLNNSSHSWSHFVIVFNSYLKVYGVFAVILISVSIASMRKCLRENKVTGCSWSLNNIFQFSGKHKPFLTWKIDLPWVALIFGVSVIVSFMGWHPGQGVLYYHHLVTPFLLWVVLNMAHAQMKKSVLVAVLMLFAVFMVGRSVVRAPSFSDTSREWYQWETLLASQQVVFHNPPLAYFALRQGKTIYDTGMTEYFCTSKKKFLLPCMNKHLNRVPDFLEGIKSKVRSKSFNLIIVSEGYSPLLPFSELKKTYVLRQRLKMPMTFNSFVAQVWEPKP